MSVRGGGTPPVLPTTPDAAPPPSNTAFEDAIHVRFPVHLGYITAHAGFRPEKWYSV